MPAIRPSGTWKIKPREQCKTSSPQRRIIALVAATLPVQCTCGHLPEPTQNALTTAFYPNSPNWSVCFEASGKIPEVLWAAQKTFVVNRHSEL